MASIGGGVAARPPFLLAALLLAIMSPLLSLSPVAEAFIAPAAPLGAAARSQIVPHRSAARSDQEAGPAPRLLLIPKIKAVVLPLLLGAGPLSSLLWTATAAPAMAAAAAEQQTTTSMMMATTTMTALGEPTEAQLQAVRDAFKAFDGRDLPKAERLFDRSVKVSSRRKRIIAPSIPTHLQYQ